MGAFVYVKEDLGCCFRGNGGLPGFWIESGMTKFLYKKGAPFGAPSSCLIGRKR